MIRAKCFQSFFLSLSFVGWLGLSAPAQALTDGELKDLSIASSLLTWWFSHQQTDLIPHLQDLNTETYQLAFSNGKDHHTQHTSLIFGKPNAKAILQTNNLSVQSHWEVNLERWHSNRNYVKNPTGLVARVMPVFRYQYTPHLIQPYVEMSIGLALLSHTTLAGTEKSTHLHFAEYLGAGVQYSNLSVGYRFMHLSNGSLVLPNRATDVHSYYISWRF
jgi:hypothetical protein